MLAQTGNNESTKQGTKLRLKIFVINQIHIYISQQ